MNNVEENTRHRKKEEKQEKLLSEIGIMKRKKTPAIITTLGKHF